MRLEQDCQVQQNQRQNKARQDKTVQYRAEQGDPRSDNARQARKDKIKQAMHEKRGKITNQDKTNNERELQVFKANERPE